MSVCQTPKYSQLKCNMIVSLEPSEFLPYGRHCLLHHPGLSCLHLNNSQPIYRLDRSLVGSFSQVTMDDKSADFWKLRIFNGIEEELYVSGHTVVWSKARNVIKTFTVSSLITHSLWSNFVVDGDDPHLPELKKDSSCTKKKTIEGVSILADGNLHMYSRKGDDFVTALPFKVRDVWNFKFGLLLQRCPDSTGPNSASSISDGDNNQLTSVFCLQHPLREFAPVVRQIQGAVRYMNKPKESIVFCEDDLVLTYDKKHCNHRVWRARQITTEESKYLQNSEMQQQHQISSLRQISISSPSQSPLRLSYKASPAASILQGSSIKANPGGIGGVTRTPLNKNFYLPSTPKSARMNSPINYQNTFSPLPSLSRTPHSMISHESLCLYEPPNEAFEPLRPEICLEHVWSEKNSSMREGHGLGKASKAFLTEDICGQRYLAYLIDNLKQLRLVKFGLSNDESYWIFGSTSVINAKDAVPLKGFKIFAILDLLGVIMLYTGNVKMVKMHVSGVPMSLSYSNILRGSVGPSTPQPISTPSHPSRPTSALGNLDEVGMLSPVPELTGSGVENISITTNDDFAFTTNMAPISALPQAIGSSVIIELTSGAYFKVDVPTFSSSKLVETCMKALFYVLSNDVFTQLQIKWFALRHSPGSINSYSSEWGIFEACIREIIGYGSVRPVHKAHITQHSQLAGDSSLSPVVASKKPRHIDHGNSNDWDQLATTGYYQQHQMKFNFSDDENTQDALAGSLNSQPEELTTQIEHSPSEQEIVILSSIFPALHLVYEEQKLNTMNWSNVTQMSKLLFSMAKDLGLHNFTKSYVSDNPSLFSSSMGNLDTDVVMNIRLLTFDPNIFSNLNNLLQNKGLQEPFPVIPGVTEFTGHVLQIYDRLFKTSNAPSSVTYLSPHSTKNSLRRQVSVNTNNKSKKESKDFSQQVLTYMKEVKFSKNDLEVLPHAIALPILQALHRCKESPPSNLPCHALKLLGRQDLIVQETIAEEKWEEQPLSIHTDPMRSAWQHQESSNQFNMAEEMALLKEVTSNESDVSTAHTDDSDQHSKVVMGSSTADDNVTRLLFPNDHRVSEARRLLQSNKQVKVDLTQKPGVDHNEFMELKALRLLHICNRTLSLSVGRGMFYLSTRKPAPTESLDIPIIELTGRGAPNNSIVDLANSNIELAPDWTQWPAFHNGCAFALKIIPPMDDTSWINLNKLKLDLKSPTANNKNAMAEHAGFLFGLGLNGHLHKLHMLDIHHYLSRTHSPTTVGLLLGLGATKCGTCDMSTMRMLSVHIPALLPSSSAELEVPWIVQTAAATAVGFLFMGSAKRLVAEVMLNEIDRPPSAEGDAGSDREAYALSCGIALGLTLLGKGLCLSELMDLNIPDQLYYYMTGKRKRSGHASTQSNVMEGDQTNTDVTAPGAIMALTLIFLKTNNAALAEWFSAPNTLLLLELIKPQHLALRTTAHALVLWNDIFPSQEWVESHIPEVIKEKVAEENYDHSSDEVDMETVVQCHASIISGACFGLGLRFAGSRNKLAYETLLKYINIFLRMWKNLGKSVANTKGLYPYPTELLGRYLLESCITTCLLAVCMVVAGSGDLKCLQICNFLHVRLGNEVSYGMQMAVHMALGLLFLGECRKTLCTTNKAIAALLVSLHPCFPGTVSDNQYHLQALRHFYVLATEQRLLIPIDSSTKLPCYAQLTLQYSKHSTISQNSSQFSVMAPYMLPESYMLQSIKVNDPRHWPVYINCNAKNFKEYITHGLCVQRRAGFYPYIVDPKGYRGMLEHTTDIIKSESMSFNNPAFQGFHDIYSDNKILDEYETESMTLIQNLVKGLVKEEQTELLFVLMGILQIQHQISSSPNPNPLSVWQMRMANDYIHSAKGHGIIAAEFIAIVIKNVQKSLNKYLSITKDTLLEMTKTNPTRMQEGDGSFDILKTVPKEYKANSKMHGLISYFLYYNIPITLLQSVSTSSEESFNSKVSILKLLREKGINGQIAIQLWKLLCSH